MTSIETRQNRCGKWWCNCTYNGLDYSVEGKNVRDARKMILARIRLSRNDVVFEKKKMYPTATNLGKPPVGYAKNRIDNLR